jgi:hypothetical protein
MESRYGEPEHQRERDRIAARLRSLSEEYQLASREMALVAVVSRQGDKPGEVPLTRVVPVGVPQDTPFDGVFGMRLQSTVRPASAPGVLFRILFEDAHTDSELSVDPMMELAARIEEDGGMPGVNLAERAKHTIEALATFVKEGNTRHRGTFRAHVSRLADWLRTVLPQLSTDMQAEARRALEAIDKRAGISRLRELFQ